MTNMGVSAAAGLLLGLAVITLIDRTAATGGAEFDEFGKAAIVAICTAICTVIGAVLRHVLKGPPD